MLGDSNDFSGRLRSLVPRGWFAYTAPIRDAVLGGVADTFSWLYGFVKTLRLQTRINTATGYFLDIIGLDWFGLRFQRRPGESDDSWRARIAPEIRRERATRHGVIQALIDLTGRTPILVEPANPSDTAAYGENAYYGQQGIYGSLLLRNQIFITAFRPLGAGIASVAGYGYGYYGGYTSRYIDMSEVMGPVLDSDIYAAVKENIAAGITGWVQILDNPAPLPSGGGFNPGSMAI